MIARYIDEKTEQLRHKQFQEGFKEGFEKGFEEGLKMARDWFRRREAAAARGEPFDEPFPVNRRKEKSPADQSTSPR